MGRHRVIENQPIEPDSDKITVYIDPKWKQIRLHMTTLKAYFSNYDYAQVCYNAETQSIIIQPVAKGIPGCVMIDYPSGALMLYKFFTQNEIRFKTGKYLATWDSAMKYLLIDPVNYLGTDNP